MPSCPELSDTGAYRIAWPDAPVEEGQTVRVEENGALLYEGIEDATTVSGRPAGQYIYRVGVVDSAGDPSWLESCRVTVSPPSLGLAFSLFGVGLLVFAATLLVVVRGHRAHRRGELSG
jgi:hypothetical protein